MSALHRKYRKIPWNKPKFFKILYCGEGQETTVNGNQDLQSSWLYAKQASAVKTLTAINWSCWVKFFPCPINYGTVNFVFVPARHSSFWMTALSIKESVVTAVQRVLRTQGEKAHSQLHYHWEILGHINILINMRESITGEAQGLSRIWLLGSCLVHQMGEINMKLNIIWKIHNHPLLLILSPIFSPSWTRFTHDSPLSFSCCKGRSQGRLRKEK